MGFILQKVYNATNADSVTGTFLTFPGQSYASGMPTLTQLNYPNSLDSLHRPQDAHIASHTTPVQHEQHL